MECLCEHARSCPGVPVKPRRTTPGRNSCICCCFHGSVRQPAGCQPRARRHRRFVVCRRPFHARRRPWAAPAAAPPGRRPAPGAATLRAAAEDFAPLTPPASTAAFTAALRAVPSSAPPQGLPPAGWSLPLLRHMQLLCLLSPPEWKPMHRATRSCVHFLRTVPLPASSPTL